MGIFKSSIKNLILFLVRSSKEKIIIPVTTSIEKDKCLDGRIALITGGSSGIGLSIAKAFINHGGKCIIAGSTPKKLEMALNELNSSSAKSIVLDVTATEKELCHKIHEATKSFGEGYIDVLVNCAGLTQTTSFFDTTESVFERIMAVNVKGTFFMSKLMGKYFKENGIKGNILNVSSSSALKPAWGPYQMSKWAVRGFTVGLAQQLAPFDITVNAIAPGKTATPMMGFDNKKENLYCDGQPCGRFIIPDEISEMAVVLVSGSGRMVMGDTMYMTGGNGFF